MDNFDSALISVVMPCSSAASYVEEAIGCVSDQSNRQVELIIVDDGSTDGSNAIIECLAAGSPKRITVLHRSNAGRYAARNHGPTHAQGNYLAFLDAGDIWHPDALNQLHAAMTETSADVAYCGWQNVGKAAANTQLHIPPNCAESDAAALFLQSCAWPINGVLLRRQLIDTLRGFLEGLPTAMDYGSVATHAHHPTQLAFYRHYPRGGARIPSWRQAFGGIGVRETFVPHHPAQTDHFNRTERDTQVYGTLLQEAYYCHGARRGFLLPPLFRRAFRKTNWKACDAKCILTSLLAASVFKWLIRLVDTRCSAHNRI